MKKVILILFLVSSIPVLWGQEFEFDKPPASMAEIRVRASDILGTAVYTLEGDRAGSIRDLVISLNGDIPFVLGTYVDTGNSLYPVPPRALEVPRALSHVTLTVHPRELAGTALPSLESSQQPAHMSGWKRRASDVWEEILPSSNFNPEPLGMSDTTEMTVLATQLLSRTIYGATGDVGRVEDIMIDVETGEVIYLAVSLIDTLGSGEQYYAVPMTAFNLRGESLSLQMNLQEERLDSAEGFDQYAWPAEADPNLIEER